MGTSKLLRVSFLVHALPLVSYNSDFLACKMVSYSRSVICTCSNTKVSYSCMKNMRSIIKSHNAKIIRKHTRTETGKKCNCRNKADCPLRGECLTKAVIYKASVSCNGVCKSYIGLSGGPFKERFRNHVKSFKHERYETETELSKHVWKLKRKQRNYTIKWEIMKRSNTNRRKSGQCNLCVEEKLAIMTTKEEELINKKSELISKCRHRKTQKKKEKV